MGREAISALNCNFFPLQAYLRFCGLAHEVKCRRNAEFMSPTGAWFVICIFFGGRISYPELYITLIMSFHERLKKNFKSVMLYFLYSRQCSISKSRQRFDW